MRKLVALEICFASTSKQLAILGMTKLKIAAKIPIKSTKESSMLKGRRAFFAPGLLMSLPSWPSMGTMRMLTTYAMAKPMIKGASALKMPPRSAIAWSQ